MVGRLVGWAFVLVLGVGLAVPRAFAASNESGVAVIVGNKTYQGRIPAVDYAHNDAEAIKRFVLDVLGFDPDNIIDLRDATQAQMQAAFGNRETHKGKLWRYLDPKGGSDVVVFYSGHGVPGQNDRRGYLLPTDANPDDAEINGYPVGLLYKNLGKLKARSKTILLDACFSGDSPKGMLIRLASPVFIEAKAPEIGENMTVLTAASGSQLASWDKKAQHGLFTEHLLRGLYGEADKDKNGSVTLGEVKEFLDNSMTRAARRTFGRDQTATALGKENWVLSSYLPSEPPVRPKIEVATEVPKPAPVSNAAELAFWGSIKDSTDPNDFTDYLRQFPNGTFARLARRRLEVLKRNQAARASPRQSTPTTVGSAIRVPSPNRYLHPEGRFALLVPADAEAQERDDGIALSINSSKGYLVNIQMGAANPSLDQSQMAAKLEERYLGPGRTWSRKLMERMITVGGLDAYDGVYEGERTRTRVIIARGLKTDFIIMFFAPPRSFDTLVGEFDGILGTFAPGADEVVAMASTIGAMKQYADKDFGYAIDYPGDWTFAKSSPFTMLFTGRRGTPAFDATISVQTIRPPGVPAPDRDLAAALLADLKAQLASGAKDVDYFGEGRYIYERSGLRLAGYEFLVTYTRGPMRHRQWTVIIPRPRGDVAHVWSYIAPVTHFDAFRPVAEAMHRSWQVFPDAE